MNLIHEIDATWTIEYNRHGHIHKVYGFDTTQSAIDFYDRFIRVIDDLK
uniref:Uncharacterized protein n=1 Tax=viral metagenome TaxID=1070528 RepID=A0A6C0JVU2_9ZZZZ